MWRNSGETGAVAGSSRARIREVYGIAHDAAGGGAAPARARRPRLPGCRCTSRASCKQEHRRAHQHQPQQGRPHRPPAQRRARRHAGAHAARLGHRVEVQNYIDDTGVQVADVVVGFRHLRGKETGRGRRLIDRSEPFDYFCWDLYATAPPRTIRRTRSRGRGGARHAARHREAARATGRDGPLVADAIVRAPRHHAAAARRRVRPAAARERHPRACTSGRAFELLKERRHGTSRPRARTPAAG
jgi:hypothetical protein